MDTAETIAAQQAGQQDVLRRALDLLAAGAEVPDVPQAWRALVTSSTVKRFGYVHADHAAHDSDACPDWPVGRDCPAVTLARAIVAAARVDQARLLHQPMPSVFPLACGRCVTYEPDDEVIVPTPWPCDTAQALGASTAAPWTDPWTDAP